MDATLPNVSQPVANGLSAKLAEERLLQFGFNEIDHQKKISPFHLFFSQLVSFLTLILIIAGAVAFLIGERVDALFIFAIVLLNACLGFWQEYKAERAIQALKKLTVSRTTVIRDGIEQHLDSRFLVPGDVILLAEGDKIPADAKVIESSHFETNEAALTGESLPVYKNPHDEEASHIFMGTVVARGRAKAVVEQTGMQTKFGQIARSLTLIQEEPTPLQKQLDVLGKQLGILVLFIAVVLFFVGLSSGRDIMEMFLISVSLSVAAIPEGLPAIVTITLAVGVQRLVRKKTIMRRLAAVETLGAASVICTDKTGTLTKNEMTVRKIWTCEGDVDVGKNEHKGKEVRNLHELIRCAVLCNNAKLVYRHDHGSSDVIGDPTEGGLLIMATTLGYSLEEIKEQSGTFFDEFGFDPHEKLMTVAYQKGKDVRLYTKGAPEVTVSRCTKFLCQGEEKELDDETKGKILQACYTYARKRYRIIALATRSYDQTVFPERREVEKNLTFLGFVAMADPPREGVKEAVSICKKAGIQVVMLTGDNEVTAESIALEIGLIEKNEDVLTGEQLDSLSEDEISQLLPRIRIFARISPHHKLKIVQAYQRNGHVVAVTGDGVNDALALKQSEVGVAMGLGGTDVAKEASDMIITDDNFVTVVHAIEEGRVIYANITKTILYLLSCNTGEVLTIAMALFANLPTPLLPVQILWMNLVTDGPPALALAADTKALDIMHLPPRGKDHNILNVSSVERMVSLGVVMAVLTLLIFFFFLQRSGETVARTIAFSSLILFQMVAALAVRGKQSPLSNVRLLWAIFLTIFIQVIILLSPFLRGIFRLGW